MPHTLRNSPIERRFAYLWEDVQSFIKALRVYEFKDRWVAFFAAQEYMPRAKEYIHYFRIFVIPKAKKGEEGWFEPYMIVWDVQGSPEPINYADLLFTYNSAMDKFYYLLEVGVGDGNRGYVNVGIVYEKLKKIYYSTGPVDIDWKPSNKVMVVSF